VTFDDVQRRIGEPELCLLDARPQGEFDKGHIPGAILVDAKVAEKMAAKPGALILATSMSASGPTGSPPGTRSSGL
jgi:rhodanese-related sulfurtransferase